MSFFVFDVETLGIESTSVCLSLSMVYCDPESLSEDNNEAYQQLLKESVFVKFRAMEQVKAGRQVCKSVIDWWDKQGDIQKKAAIVEQKDDVLAHDGLMKLRKFWSSYKDHKDLPIWIRGTLDQMILESLQRTFEVDSFISYNCYRDVRTAIELLYSDTAKAGYVAIPEFDQYQVIKHHPTHDCAYDALQLIRGQ